MQTTVPEPTSSNAIWISRFALLVQALCLLVVVFIPFGFDIRSSWGLDFDDLLFVLVLDVAAILIGATAAFIARRVALGLLQLTASPALMFLALLFT